MASIKPIPSRASSTSFSSTVDAGAAFRDEVIQYLQASGHPCEGEIRLNHKQVDIVCQWKDRMFGERVIAIETKRHRGNLRMADCTAFCVQYGPLVQNGFAKECWLITSGNLSPDARALVDSYSGLKAFTHAEFLWRLFGVETYLRDFLAESYLEPGEEYVPPKTSDGKDVRQLVSSWLKKPDLQLLVLGGYGVGKSTFALHLARELASNALLNPSSRAPLYIPLGEVYDEQSISGLIGRLLTDRYIVPGYSYPLFSRLNTAGRFLIIFDGLDEMADGMTAIRFERNFRRLLSLDEGAAKLLFLGRQTAFHSAAEFDQIVGGRSKTPAGTSVQTFGRRPLQTAEIRGFGRGEAKRFLRSYFTRIARQSQHYAVLGDAWIESRLSELTAPALRDLIDRPVHAQMLCQIATSPEAVLSGLSLHGLYDTFVHHLLERENVRAVRHQGFDLEQRRSFNAALAYWAWQNDSGTSVKYSAIPLELWQKAIASLAHDYDAEELKRELVAGCLVDGGGDRAYYRHRSIQEFLVAEFVGDTLREHYAHLPLASVFETLATNPSALIFQFLIGRLESAHWPAFQVDRLLHEMFIWRGENTPKILLNFILEVIRGRLSAQAKRSSVSSSSFQRKVQVEQWQGVSAFDGRWQFLLSHFLTLGRSEFRFVPEGLREDTHKLRSAQNAGPNVLGACLLLWARCLCEGKAPDAHRMVFFEEVFGQLALREKPSALATMSGTFATEDHKGDRYLEVNLDLLWKKAASSSGVHVEADPNPPTVILRESVSALAARFAALGWPQTAVDRFQTFYINREYRSAPKA